MSSTHPAGGSAGDLTLAGSHAAIGTAVGSIAAMHGAGSQQKSMNNINSITNLIETPQDEILMLILSGKYRFKVVY